MSTSCWHPRNQASLLHPSQEGCSYSSTAVLPPRNSLPYTSLRTCKLRRHSRLSTQLTAQQNQPQPGRGGPGQNKTYGPSWERQSQYDYPPASQPSRPPPSGPPPPPPENNNGFGSDFTKALLAGVFILGIGTGVWFDSQVSLYPSNVASTEIIDRKTPNSEVCMASGYSSMVFDQRIFVSFSP